MRRAAWVDAGLTLGYILLFVAATLVRPVHSMDRVMLQLGHGPIAFEFLVSALFFPLLIIDMTGTLRMILIWGALKRNVLQALEGVPIRFAFDRLKVGGWVSIFRQSGLREQWLDMARSTESMRQLVRESEILESSSQGQYQCRFCADPELNPLRRIYEKLEGEIAALLREIQDPKDDLGPPPPPPCDHSLDVDPSGLRNGLKRMHAIELLYADFSAKLLEIILIPYWVSKKRDLCRACPRKMNGIAKKKRLRGCPRRALRANTRPMFNVQRNLSLSVISRHASVLVNLRYLMTFVTTSFALAIIAWNSYPFEPRSLSIGYLLFFWAVLESL